MIYAYLMAVIVVMHPTQGMKHVPFVGRMAHGAEFKTQEKCMNWMRKTGDDSADVWESEIEKGPFVVIKYRTVCMAEGVEI